jgi:hypothetical protein
VRVYVQTHRAVRSLNRAHRPRMGASDASQREKTFASSTQRQAEFFDEGADHLGAKNPVIPEQRPQSPWQRHDPMPNRHGREHALLQMHGAVRHAAAQARRAKPAAFATQSDQLRVPAATAGQVKAAPFQDATTDERFSTDESPEEKSARSQSTHFHGERSAFVRLRRALHGICSFRRSSLPLPLPQVESAKRSAGPCKRRGSPRRSARTPCGASRQWPGGISTWLFAHERR